MCLSQQSVPLPLPEMPAGAVPNLHTHTTCSVDGHQTLDALCDAAATAKLSVVCVTDHCDFDPDRADCNEREIKNAFLSFDQTRQKKEDRFLLLAGIELGEAMQSPASAAACIAGRRWDFILGSLHNTLREQDAYHIDFSSWTKEQAQALYVRYLTQLGALAEQGDFDALAHITYPIRYITGNYGIHLDEDVLLSLYDRILLALLQRDKALEVNVGGIRKKIGLPSPDLPLIRRFYALGGRKITLGSDAHYTEHMASDLAPMLPLLQEIGYAGITCYVQRKPFLLPFTVQ